MRIKVENHLVVYNDFQIMKKLETCSLVSYLTIYGEERLAIVLNDFNRIVFKFSTSSNPFAVNILDKQNQMFRSSKGKEFINLKGEYRLSDYEYIINFPYSVNIEISNGNTAYFFVNRISDLLRENILKLNKDRMNYAIKRVGISDELKFYEYDKISQFIWLIRKNDKQKMVIDDGDFQVNTEGSSSNEINSKVLADNSIPIEVLDIEKSNSEIDVKLDSEIDVKPSSIFNKVNSMGNLEPEKKLRSFIVTSRNLSIVKYLKNLYEDHCQICGETIEISPGSFLSEVHHIKPLGVHNGPDVAENVIVLCPNHHAMFDRGAITIDIDKKVVIHFNPANPLNNKRIDLKHKIDGSYIAFHNMNIFINCTDYQNQEDIIFAKDEIAATIQTVDFGNIVTLQDMDTSELFDIKLEDKFNKDFMKPIEKVIFQKCLNDIVRYEAFRYKVISICAE